MRRKEKEITRREDIEDVLRRAPVLHLGLVDNGKAYVVPLDYGYADGALYFHSAQAGRKVEVMKANPNVFFQVEVDHQVVTGSAHTCKNWTSRFKSVMGEGKAVFIADLQEKIKAVDIIMGKLAPGPFVYDNARIEKTAVIRIDIEWMTGKSHGF